MPKVELSIQARNDLASVWYYISEQSSDHVADKFIDSLSEVCQKIANMPTIGRPQDFLRKGLRKHSFKRYSIYYDIADNNHIVIRRFWHQSRDLENMNISE
ncbi:MAG: type II toxin-antitoxin system RelE/ParE family toxin [Cytophagales bacterium]|nr:type II toxin-antitoxin system RelE/ParE family toxin [Cytophagales bacterium]